MALMYEVELYFSSLRAEARSLLEIEQVVKKWAWCDPKNCESI